MVKAPLLEDDVPKSGLVIGGEYAPVADRIALFYQRWPAGRIVTDMIAHNEREVVFRASVYRSEEAEKPASTGWASERFGDGDVNTVACLENTETSAIGRALANLGFTASRMRPSLEEMQKAALVRQPADRPHYQRAAGNQELADVTVDFLTLVRAATRYGLRPARANRLRAQALAGNLEAAERNRLEEMLRRWIARRIRAHVSHRE